ncbi:MAG: MerR family transcriptional regulator [Desulfuromonadales bacterium]|jgi:DNA-binding transcriptional MerR regulator
MKTYSISQLANAFGLSRSTLLYYDRVGVLSASERTASGYRRYTEQDYNKLERICMFRGTGLALADIKIMFAGGSNPSVSILEKRLRDLDQDILELRTQQHLITAMLKNMTSEDFTPAIDKKAWVEMLESAGMDERGMKAWHAEFERRSPEAHYEFLLSLGIPESEARRIQNWSQDTKS